MDERNSEIGDNPALRMEGVSLVYGGTVIVDRVDLTVGQAEILCLLGESGSGKSSILRLVAGIERPSEGSIRLSGEPVAGPNVRFVPPERRSVGLVFQDFALFPHLSVLANVTFGLSGVPGEEARARGAEMLDRVGLAHKASLYPHTLSGGEQQRVALARALAPRPRLLLLDEPFSSLDARMRADLRDSTVDILKADGLAALFVTHDADEAMAAGDRLALLRNGGIIQTGGSAELYDAPVDPEAGRLFGPLNLVPGRMRAGRAESPLGAVSAADRADGEPVWLAFRPDGAHIGFEKSAAGAPATIEKVQPGGADMAVRVRLDGWPDRALDLKCARDERLAPGAAVYVSLVAGRAIVFGDEAVGAPSSEGF